MRHLLQICIFSLLSLTITNAFDTGHHYDATRNGLLLRGFDPAADSINIVQLQNFAADWNALGKYIKFPNFKNVYDKCNLLHFNSLYNTTMVRKYWVQLYNNTYHAVNSILQSRVQLGTQESFQNIPSKLLTVQQSNNETFPLFQKEFLLLSVLGMTLHAHQDFYTHSNWITAQRKDQGKTVIDDNNGNGATVSEFKDPNDDDCYYPQGSYDPLLPNDYNLHTYYYPETDEELNRVKKQYNYTDLIRHGGYYDGINKDSYSKRDFDFSYVNAVMQTVDTVDTFKLWIKTLDPTNADQLWKNIQSYKLTRQQDINNLKFGTEHLFSVSAYVELAWWQKDSTSGHWKGYGSGDTSSTLAEADYAISDFQDESIFQMFVWNTGLLDTMVYHMNLIDRVDVLPMFSEATIKAIMPQRVVNDPSLFKTITVKTHQVSKNAIDPTQSTTSKSSWDGLYAVVGIEGMFFREAPLYSTELYPWWQSIRVIEKSITRISISYDLAIWTPDLEDTEQLAHLSPYTLFIKPIVNLFHSIVSLFSSNKQPAEVRTEKLTSMNDGSNIKRETIEIDLEDNDTIDTIQKRLKRKFKTEELNLDRFSISLSGAEREAIEADVIVNKTGVFFLYDADKGTIIDGLAKYKDVRVDSWPEHQLLLLAQREQERARVNVTIHTRNICKASYVTGTIGFAPVANTTYNLLFPNYVGPPVGVGSAFKNMNIDFFVIHLLMVISATMVYVKMR